MEIESLILDIEYAILEQNIAQIKGLFHKLKLRDDYQGKLSFFNEIWFQIDARACIMVDHV